MKSLILTMTLLLSGGLILPATLTGSETTPPAKPAIKWIPIEDEIWNVLKEAPAYHFEQAKSDWQKKDYKGAAAEIDQGKRFMKLQEKRLNASMKELQRLETDLNAGRITAAKELDAEFTYALKALDQGTGVVPLEEESKDFFAFAPNYHLEKAKNLLDKKENKGAASELRLAIAYMKWRAQFEGDRIQELLNESVKELSDLARKLNTGLSATEAEITHAFSKAKAAIGGNK